MTVFTWGTFGQDLLSKPKLLRFCRQVMTKVSQQSLEIKDIVLSSSEIMVLLKKPPLPKKEKAPALIPALTVSRLPDSLPQEELEDEISDTTETDDVDDIEGYGEEMQTQHIEQMIANVKKSQPNTNPEFSERVVNAMKLFLELCDSEQEAVRLLIKEHESETELNLTTDIEFTLLSKCNGKQPNHVVPSDRFSVFPAAVTVSQWKPLVIDDISFQTGSDFSSLGTRSYQSSLIATLKHGGNFLVYLRSKDRGRDFKEASVWLSPDGRQLIYMENQVAHKSAKKVPLLFLSLSFRRLDCDEIKLICDCVMSHSFSLFCFWISGYRSV